MKNYTVDIELPVFIRFSVAAKSEEESLKKIYEYKEWEDCDFAPGFYIHDCDTAEFSRYAYVEDDNGKYIEYVVDADNGIYKEKIS